MQGLSIADLKKHPALIPLYLCFAAGAVGAAYYTIRLATRNPDVTWSQKKNPEPWQEYSDKQYKVTQAQNIAGGLFEEVVVEALRGVTEVEHRRLNNGVSSWDTEGGAGLGMGWLKSAFDQS